MRQVKRIEMLGALMDEYERASIDLKQCLLSLDQEAFIKLRDRETKDPDCRSIQTITGHVVNSGYTYANYINSVFSNEWKEFTQVIENTKQGVAEIDKMLNYTNLQLSDKYELPLEIVETWSFDTRWKVTYDIEQLLEHAIVHLLRHRRQIEGFLEKEQRSLFSSYKKSKSSKGNLTRK